MSNRTIKPFIVQSDLTVLLDETVQEAGPAREKLLLFAETTRRAGSVHTYKITPLTLWHAAAGGICTADIIGWLNQFGRYELPVQAEATINLYMARYGQLTLTMQDGCLVLRGKPETLAQLDSYPSVASYVADASNPECWLLHGESRGLLKQELIRLGYPVIDRAGYHHGEQLEVELREQTRRGKPFMLRYYQQEAVEQFYADGTVQSGSGVVVLPCGAGKTIVGIAALARLSSATLILTSNRTSVEQWKEELLDKTTLKETDIGEYGGTIKQVRPVTIATYSMLTHRKAKHADFTHIRLFSERDWGLIIYDEVHLLPAPVFRMTAELQATRRLGLTAALVREDGCAEDVFALIGPKQYEMHWKTAEAGSFIASVACTEIRVPLDGEQAVRYREAGARTRLRLAAENPLKMQVARQLLERHKGKPTLIIGQYLDQLHDMADYIQAPLLTGEVAQAKRKEWYGKFKSGEISVLIVSKVANFAVDLPDAAVAIQLSGSYGSRQEEAQRIGRLLRPKSGDNSACFYTLVSDNTKETEFALRRQSFMLEQGYGYERQYASEHPDAGKGAALL
jgi:DNA excision repair protein ERCC-3